MDWLLLNLIDYTEIYKIWGKTGEDSINENRGGEREREREIPVEEES